MYCTYVIYLKSFSRDSRQEIVWLSLEINETVIENIFQSATMTNKQNTFMFIKSGPYDGTSDDLYSEIVRYCQAIDKSFLKKKNDSKNGITLYTCKDIMCPFRVKARRQSDTAVWNVTQDSLNLDHIPNSNVRLSSGFHSEWTHDAIVCV